MSESFFGFGQSGSSGNEKNVEEEEEDDVDYDALNSETFGEFFSEPDWEDIHAMFQSELEQQLDEENSELSERVASSILEDEVEEPTALRSSTPVFANELLGTRGSNGSPFPYNNVHPPTCPPRPPQILTVEELERRMRRDAEMNKRHVNSPASNMPFDKLEREMPTCSNMRQNVSSNGHYTPRDIPTDTSAPLINQSPRGRFQNNERIIPDSYPAVHPPFPLVPDLFAALRPPPIPRPSPAPRHPQTPRPPHIYHPPRHTGHMYSRHPNDPFARFYGPQRQMNMPDYHPQPPLPFYHHQHPGAFGSAPFQAPVDEYAGMMTPQEKQWLASIQLMTLATNQPLQDDYYYVMNLQRQQGTSGRKLNNHAPKNNREVAAAKPGISSNYAPLQFENSLGKLQIGSVTAPRKIIDREVVENIDTNPKHHVDRKSKQILMEIEEIYSAILELEGPPSSDEPLDYKVLQDKMLTSILAGNKLASIMAIRKGKKAVFRLYPLLPDPSGLTRKILIDMIPITKKDTEQVLLSFLPNVRAYLSKVDLKELVEIVQTYDASFLLANKFSVSVLANMVERAEQVIEEAQPSQVEMWLNFLQQVAKATDYWTNTERPVVAVPRNTLTSHLDRIKDIAEEDHIQRLIRVLCVLQPSANVPTAHASDLCTVPVPTMAAVPVPTAADLPNSSASVPASVEDVVPSSSDTKI